MKQMIIEKILELPYGVDEIQNIKAENSITYQKEENGIRALGKLNLEGQVLSDNECKEFHEVVTLDILAPYKKLNSKFPFSIDFHHYDAKLVNRDILIVLYLDLNGIQDEEYEDTIMVEEDYAQEAEQSETQVEECIECAHEENEIKERTQNLIEMIDPTENTKELEEKLPSEFEDLFDDKENTKVKTRMVKLLPHDSYTSIAERYHVDLKRLMELNKGKNLENCTLITLPND